MPGLSLLFVVAVFSILGCFLAALHSFLVYKSSRLSRAWLAVTYGMILFSIDRLIVFSDEFGIFNDLIPTVLKTWSGVLVLLATGLLIWGFWSLRHSFETFDVIEKKSREKAKLFEKSQEK